MDKKFSFLCKFLIIVIAAMLAQHYFLTKPWKLKKQSDVLEKSLNLLNLDPALTTAIPANDTQQKKLNFQFEGETVSRWKEFPECANFKTSFVKQKTLPFVALVSHPGSGNTWTRYIIESLTGVFTGDIYSDSKLAKVFPGSSGTSPYKGSTFACKVHFSLESLMRRSHRGRGLIKKVVLVIRNPFLANLAEYNRQHSGHLGTARGIFRHHKLFSRSSTAGKWSETIHSWINWARWAAKKHKVPVRSKIHVMFYEQILSNFEEEIGKLVQFLNFELDENRLKCLMDHPQGHFKRQTKIIKPLFPYSYAFVKRMLSGICSVNKKFSLIGMEKLPVKTYQESINL